MLEERLILGNHVALGTGDNVVVGYVNGYSKRGKIVREDKDFLYFKPNGENCFSQIAKTNKSIFIEKIDDPIF